jgi:hypothetical protein
MRILTLVFVAFSLAFASTSLAGGKSKSKPLQGSAYFNFISATTQRTLPGMRGAEPITTYRFLIVWKGSKEPGAFFYKPATGGWITCQVSKVHYIKGEKIPEGALPYTSEVAQTGMIKKGDTLEILPTPGGRYAIPSVIPAFMSNTLFFQVNTQQWYYFQVKKWTRLPDIAMP